MSASAHLVLIALIAKKRVVNGDDVCPLLDEPVELVLDRDDALVAVEVNAVGDPVVGVGAVDVQPLERRKERPDASGRNRPSAKHRIECGHRVVKTDE